MKKFQNMIIEIWRKIDEIGRKHPAIYPPSKRDNAYGMIFGIIFFWIGIQYTVYIEEASKGSLIIYSIPSGAEVYVAPEGTLMAENVDLKPKIGSPESKVGQISQLEKMKPLKLKLAQGSYDVGVKISAEQMYELLGKEKSIGFYNDGDFVIQYNYDPSSGNVESYMKIYKLRIISKQDTNLIALFQPKNVSFSDLVSTSLFPPSRTFQFNDEGMKNNLLRNNATTSDIPALLNLLHRGGKIVWEDDERRYVVDLINKDRYISVYTLT